MRFPQIEVERLLTERYEQIELIWDRDPYDEVNAIALTIKEFMRDHQIGEVDAGIRAFLAFKKEQSRALADVGLDAGGDFSARLPSSPRLATQAA